MKKKLLYFSVLLPMSVLAQTSAQQEIAAKMLASQQPQPVMQASFLQPQECEAIVPPYSENFESAVVPALPACTSTVNAGSGNVWTTDASSGYGFTNKKLRYAWNTANPANTWFFTRGLSLTAGVTYSITYRYGSAGSTLYTEKLKVHIGTDASPGAMGATPLIDHPLVNNNVTPIFDNLTFTPETSGVYFIGFHCYSNADQFYLFLDDITVSSTLGVNDRAAKSVKAYPNPVRDVLHIENPDARIESVALYNLLGQKVAEAKAGANVIDVDVSSLERGYYILETSGGNTSRMKIAKY